MSKSELAKRYILFIISLFFSAVGVAFTKRAALGVSPISSVANVLNCKFPSLSLGSWLILWNCALIIGQIILLRRKFRLVQLLQIPLSFVFGWFTDLGVWMVSFLPADNYGVKIAMVLIGIIILAFGIALSVIANVVMNSGEAFVKAVADAVRKEFGSVKIAFDVSCVALALILSLVFFDFRIVGTREGTLISAFLTGVAVKCWLRLLKNPVTSVLSKR